MPKMAKIDFGKRAFGAKFSPSKPHLIPWNWIHRDRKIITLSAHLLHHIQLDGFPQFSDVAIKFRIPINTSGLNLWLQRSAHAVPRTWRLMNIIAGALLRGEAQIITYDTLYVQRFMSQSVCCVGFGTELWGSSSLEWICWEEARDFCVLVVGGWGIIGDVGEWDRPDDRYAKQGRPLTWQIALVAL